MLKISGVINVDCSKKQTDEGNGVITENFLEQNFSLSGLYSSLYNCISQIICTKKVRP